MSPRLGIVSMVAAVMFGWLASALHEFETHAALANTVAVIAAVCFALWAAVGIRLWILLWRWLFRTWSTRSAIANVGWGALIMAGSIVLPFFLVRRLTIKD